MDETEKLVADSEELVAEIDRRALLFCVDNPRFGNELAAIKSAMLIGALVVVERK